MTLVHSFDVFDTCLTRTVARPTDLFFLLAERLLSPPVTSEQIADLARLRIQAEDSARQAATREEITLSEIYRHLPNLDYWGISAGQMMQAEIQLEREAVRPISAVKQKIEALRRQEQRIIFISDMYLPQAVIKAMLLETGLAQPDDPIYVSGEIGLAKSSGKLFDYVLTQEAIQAGQLWHTGDNPYADVTIPARMGISTTFFQSSHLNRYEQLTLAQSNRLPWVQAQLAGISRSVRLATRTDDRFPALTDFAANVAAPLLTAFVAWVITDAQKRGLDRLYFVARDGQILWKIAQKLAETMPAPECRYLYGSRQAWLLPSIFECNEQDLDWLFLHATTPISLLKKLEIQPDEVGEILAEHNFTGDQFDQPLDDERIGLFWQVIKHPSVSALILHKAAAARRTTLAYFEQEGLLTSAWAMVDVGWALRGQRAVRKIVRSVQPDFDPFGYYLTVADNRRPIAEAGPYSAFLLPAKSPAPDSTVNMVLNNTILMEHLFLMADHGTTSGYRSDRGLVRPEMRAAPLMDIQPDFVGQFHSAILHYVSELGQTALLAEYQAELKQTALVLLKRFLSKPDQDEAKIAAHIPTVIDQTHSDGQYRFLTKRLGIIDVIYLLKYVVARFFRHQNKPVYSPDYDWLAGSVAISGWGMRLVFLPILWSFQFKQNNGRWRFYHKWAKLVAKEKL